MACKIEIRKTIDNSIDNELPYREAVMAKPAADKISKAINKLWGKISRVVQYSGIGGYRVIIPEQNIQEAADKEYTKQEKAEAELMKDHEFFREPVQAPVEIKEEPVTLQEATQLTIPFEEAEDVKPGVAELFESNTELANIGTQEQYSQYLNTIFPDSQVKDIVYHGTDNFIGDYFDKLLSQVSNGIYFSIDKEDAEGYAHRKFYRNNEKGKKIIIPAILNIKNPKIEEDGFFANKNENYDAIFTYTDYGAFNYRAVFEPEQIHILGSEQDIQGFRDFVAKGGSAEINDEISLYLATKMKEDLGVDIPIKNTDLYNLVSTKAPITKEDIDNKKSEC